MKCLSDLGCVLGSWCWLCTGGLGSELGLQGGGDQAGGFDGGNIRPAKTFGPVICWPFILGNMRDAEPARDKTGSRS